MRTILRSIPAGARVLELGCGTGWLTLLLAKHGLRHIVGMDFSAAQVERARHSATEQGLGDRVQFVVARSDDASNAAEGAFDAVIMHAFLHHLSTAEIEEALVSAVALLAPGGRLVLLEPVHHCDGPRRGANSLRVRRRLEALPRVLLRHGLRRAGPAECTVRDRLGGRATGIPPFSPSPKEIPFRPGELVGHLATGFAIDARLPVLSMPHLVAQELLVASLSQPRLWRTVERPLPVLACAVDRRFVTHRPLPSTAWLFQLYLCTKQQR
ncbi:MAG: class I SAM-dependent methyltransferase [Actinomycetota bacterium]|nr:class I SAM-dependent methyltransferase [Actinomycetota bacterium]